MMPTALGIAFDKRVTVEAMVERVLYCGESYIVIGARHSNGTYIRIKSYRLIDPVPGETYLVSGEWRRYKDGRGITWTQIDTTDVTRTRMSGALLGPWLEKLPNIGSTRAQRLLDAFGDKLTEKLSDATNLTDVAQVIEPKKPILANKIAAQIYFALTANNVAALAAQEEMRFLAKIESLGVIDSRAARAIWRLIGGKGALERLARNPYIAASLIDWKRADHVGQRILMQTMNREEALHHPSRLLGAIDSVWRDTLAQGDTAAAPERFTRLIERKNVVAGPAISLGLERRAILSLNGLYRAPGAAWIEDQLAERLRALESSKCQLDLSKFSRLKQFVLEAEEDTNLTLSDEQRNAVVALLRKPVGILQGGAGVGKTTVMKVLVTAWEILGGNAVLGALAGKAALQLSRGTSTPRQPRLAYTVARLLSMLSKSQREKENGSSRDHGMSFDAKTLLILDEASMLDTPSLAELVSYLPPGSRLLLVGDQGQLPPVGIGCVFHDLVENKSRVVTLSQVRRQGSGSPIPQAASAIREGIAPTLIKIFSCEEWSDDSGGMFIMENPTALIPLYMQLSQHDGDIMVVAARRATVENFNVEAQQQIQLNNKATTLRLGPLATVCQGDPIVCTRNRYKNGLFNGLLGKIVETTPDGALALWDGEKEPRLIDAEVGMDIELAYAITCHRAQGSSAEYVVVLVEDSSLVTREWLYTAVTRTRKTVILVGTRNAIENAVSRRTKRITGFTIENVTCSEPDSI